MTHAKLPRQEGSMAGKSSEIKARLAERGQRHYANDNIADVLVAGDAEAIESEVEHHVKAILDALVIDTDNDHNTRDTAGRVARMMVREIYKGRYLPMPAATEFPNDKKLDEMYTLGPITVRSACSHHLVPITGQAWVGVIPGDRLIGISKFVRIADWIMSRPQIQEEATVQLADTLEQLIKPMGLAVVVDAAHHCMVCRGVKEAGTTMVTSVMRGLFRESKTSRDEFLDLIRKR